MKDITHLEALISAHLYSINDALDDNLSSRRNWFEGHKRLRDALGRKITVHFDRANATEVVRHLTKHGRWKGE